MYAHLLSSAGVRDDDQLFTNENEKHVGRDILGSIATPEISNAPSSRRLSGIGGTPPPRPYPTHTTVGTVDSLRETVPALNRALADLGYAPLELLLPDATDLARTCDTLFSLLRDRQEDLAAREAWADERRRLRADVVAAETKAGRLRVSRDADQAARAADANRRDRAEETTRTRLETISGERDAARKEARTATQRLVKLEHDAKRKELEHDRLKARLGSIIDANAPPTVRQNQRDVHRGGVTITTGGGNIAVAQSSVAKNVPKNSEHHPSPAVSLALHYSMMSAYEAKLRGFMHDTNDLKRLLRERGVDVETGAKKVSGEMRGSSYVGEAKQLGTEIQPVLEEEHMAVVAVEAGISSHDIPPHDTSSPSTETDAFAFNLGALRDRLHDAEEETETKNNLDDANASDDDARTAFEASVSAAAPSSPVEIALRWHEKEHARLSKDLENESGRAGSLSASVSTSLQGSPKKRNKQHLSWNRQVDVLPAFVKPKTPKSLRRNALEASPEVSSSEGEEEGEEIDEGIFNKVDRVSVSSEEVVEDTEQEKEEAEMKLSTPRCEKYNANRVETSREPVNQPPASPASPLDALLAKHLIGKSQRSTHEGPPKERSAWLERRRRRANPFE